MTEKNVSSDFGLRKCAEEEEQLVDRISELPNDVLVCILSLLPLEDAARTSVLSKRWIDLWMFVSRLDFDGAKDCKGVERKCVIEYYDLRRSNHCKYVNWVDKVLQSHKAMALDMFRLRIDLDKDLQNDISKWIQYAFSRRVQRMDLNFSNRSNSCYPHHIYRFPDYLLDPSSINSDVLSGLNFLKALTFTNVNVSDQDLKFFLKNCPFLEHLAVKCSSRLSRLEVRGQSLALKHLEIICTHYLKSLTICDTNIVSLKVTQGDRLMLKNVPMLVDVCIGELHVSSFVSSAISLLSSCLTKLQVLTLKVKTHIVLGPGTAMDSALPQLTELKQLTVVSCGIDDSNLDELICFIRACPSLEKLVVQLCSNVWMGLETHTTSLKALAFLPPSPPPPPHHRLKVVEIWGYFCQTPELRLINYLVENCVALERIVIDTRPPRWLSGFEVVPQRKHLQVAALAAYIAKPQLQELVPSHIQLSIFTPEGFSESYLISFYELMLSCV